MNAGLLGIEVVSYALGGVLLGSLLCMIPSLHIYNVTGIALLIWLEFRDIIPYHAIAPFFMSMMVAFAFINTIPMTFLSAADESAGASILPSLDMVMNGRGREASILSGVGTLIGAVILVLLTPFFYYIWTYVAVICKPQVHWMLGLVMVFYIMSEWPKGAGRGKNPWQKFKDGWRNVFAGMLTFALSAAVGIIVTTKPLAPPELAFQNIMPIFLGFFAFPSLIQTLMSNNKPPEQYKTPYIAADWTDFASATLPGVVGGLMCAYLPAVTVGIAAIFASHMTNHRNLRPASFESPTEPGTVVRLHTPEIYWQSEKAFLIGGGITKIMYYVGAFLLIFVLTELTPNGMGRGGMNVILKPVFSAEKGDYFIVLSSVLFTSSVCMLLLIWLTDLTLKILPKLNIKLIYYCVTVMLLAILWFMGGGLNGLLVAAVTTCIGCIPVFYNCRRSHCMAVLLVPIVLNMAGYGDAIARFLRLA